jgi:hypothetical protein
MAEPRTVEDRLRSEYAELLPAMHRTRVAIETEVQHLLLPATLALDPYERIIVRARVKECESAVDALRRRQDFGRFDTDRPEQYSLTMLPDLVGVRVLTFPRSRLLEVRDTLLPRIAGWRADPVADDDSGEPIAFKYSGRWKPEDQVKSEIQVVSLLIGLFWEAEHAAIYKPTPNLRGVAKSIEMRRRRANVVAALRDFELEFGRLIEAASGTDGSE